MILSYEITLITGLGWIKFSATQRKTVKVKWYVHQMFASKFKIKINSYMEMIHDVWYGVWCV